MVLYIHIKAIHQSVTQKSTVGQCSSTKRKEKENSHLCLLRNCQRYQDETTVCHCLTAEQWRASAGNLCNKQTKGPFEYSVFIPLNSSINQPAMHISLCVCAEGGGGGACMHVSVHVYMMWLGGGGGCMSACVCSPSWQSSDFSEPCDFLGQLRCSSLALGFHRAVTTWFLCHMTSKGNHGLIPLPYDLQVQSRNDSLPYGL